MEQRPRSNGRDEPAQEPGDEGAAEETSAEETPVAESTGGESSGGEQPDADLTETVDVRHVEPEASVESDDAEEETSSRWFSARGASAAGSEGGDRDDHRDESADAADAADAAEPAEEPIARDETPAAGESEPSHTHHAGPEDPEETDEPSDAEPPHHARRSGAEEADASEPSEAPDEAPDSDSSSPTDSADAEPPHHARAPRRDSSDEPAAEEPPRPARPSRPAPPQGAAGRPPRPGAPGGVPVGPGGRPLRPGAGMPQGATPRGPRPPLPPGAGPRGPRPFVTQPPRAPHGAPGQRPPQGAAAQGAAGPNGRRPHHPSIERQRLQAAFWPPRLSRNQLVVGLLLAILGAALAIQVRATNTSDQLLRAARPDDLVHILDDTTARGQRLDTELRQLEAQKASLQNSSDKAQAALQQAQEKAKDLQILAGTTKATGPGITVTITDPQHKVDAAALLNALQELRAAGAEVVQLDNVRIVVSSSFLDSAAGQVSVDGQVLTAPYVFKVIGDPATLQPALGIPGGVVANLKSNYGATTDIATNQHILVDAVAPQPNPQYASAG